MHAAHFRIFYIEKNPIIFLSLCWPIALNAVRFVFARETRILAECRFQARKSNALKLNLEKKKQVEGFDPNTFLKLFPSIFPFSFCSHAGLVNNFGPAVSLDPASSCFHIDTICLLDVLHTVFPTVSVPSFLAKDSCLYEVFAI